MTPVTNAAQADKQQREVCCSSLFTQCLMMPFEEIWFPKAIFKLELSPTSFYKMCNHTKSNQQMVLQMNVI